MENANFRTRCENAVIMAGGGGEDVNVESPCERYRQSLWVYSRETSETVCWTYFSGFSSHFCPAFSPSTTSHSCRDFRLLPVRFLFIFPAGGATLECELTSDKLSASLPSCRKKGTMKSLITSGICTVVHSLSSPPLFSYLFSLCMYLTVHAHVTVRSLQ